MAKYRLFWDKLGITMSAVCLVHCLALPIAIVTLPLVAAQWLQQGIFHGVMALVLVPVALFAIVPGLKVHGRRSVAAAMAAGLSLLSTAAFAGHDWLTREWEVALTLTGGAILVVAHAVNLALCRACPACADHVHPSEHR